MTGEQAKVPRGADAIVGENVHHWMWRARVSQTEMARHLGISQTNVSRRLRGETGWTVDDLLICAEVLKVSAGDLLPGRDYNPAPHDGGGIASDADEYAIADSNREPADLFVAPRLATVLQMPVRPHGHLEDSPGPAARVVALAHRRTSVPPTAPYDLGASS